MLRFFSNVFSRKNKGQSSSPRSSTSKSKTRSARSASAPKSILKKSPSTRKKKLSFSSNIKSVKEYAPDNSPNDTFNHIPRCNPPQRPKNYPCRRKNTVFETVEEFNEYARDVSDTKLQRRQQGLPSVSSHYKTMRSKLKESGSYRKKIPPEYRLYDEDTGSIIDIRMISNEEEE